jgi:hypothetical protein
MAYGSLVSIVALSTSDEVLHLVCNHLLFSLLTGLLGRIYYDDCRRRPSTTTWWTTCPLVLGRSLVGMLVAVGRRSSIDSISTAAVDALELVKDHGCIRYQDGLYVYIKDACCCYVLSTLVALLCEWFWRSIGSHQVYLFCQNKKIKNF